MCKQFEEHLRKEFSLENLNFLRTCEDYRSLCKKLELKIENVPVDDFTGGIRMTMLSTESERTQRRRISLATLRDIGRRIYQQFCARGAPHEINLSREIQRELRDFFEETEYNVMSLDVFDDAYKCIVDLLTNDSLLRFKIDVCDDYSVL